MTYSHRKNKEAMHIIIWLHELYSHAYE